MLKYSLTSLALAGAVLAWPLAGHAQKSGEVKIGINESLSGNFAAIGAPTTSAIRMAAKEINDKGGFKIGDTTYTLKIIEYDNKSNTAGAVAGMNSLIEDNGVKFVFGPTVSPLASQSEEISVPAKVIHLSGATSWQANGDLSNPNKPLLFGTQMNFNRISDIDAAAFKLLGAKKVALLGQDDDVLKAVVPGITKSLTAAGIASVVVPFPIGTADFSPYITRIKSENADGIYFTFPQARAIEALRYVVDFKAAQNGFGGRNLDPDIALKNAIGGPIPTPFFTTGNTPSFQYPPNEKVKAYAERLLAFAPNVAGPNVTLSFFNYDFVAMLVEAMKQAGSVTDTTKIGATLTGLTYDGVIGRICFGKDIRTAGLDGGLVIVRDGKVKSEEFPSSCK